MSKHRTAVKYGLAGVLSTLYGLGALHAHRHPRRGMERPWKTSVVAAGLSAATFTIAAL